MNWALELVCQSRARGRGDDDVGLPAPICCLFRCGELVVYAMTFQEVHTFDEKV